MTPRQCAAGRAARGLSRQGLRKRAGLMTAAVRRFEIGEMLPPARQRKLHTALDATGLEFAIDHGVGAGVRLRNMGR